MTAKMLREAWQLSSLPSGNSTLRGDLHADSRALQQLDRIVEAYFVKFQPLAFRPGALQSAITVEQLTNTIWTNIPAKHKRLPSRPVRARRRFRSDVNVHDIPQMWNPSVDWQNEGGASAGPGFQEILYHMKQIRGEPGRAVNEKRPRKGKLYPVWFGTNRKAVDPNDVSKGFSNERGQQTTLGRVDVLIPKAHRFGEMDSTLWTRLKRFDLRDDRISVYDTVGLSEETFWPELRERIQSAVEAGGPSHALIYLHGYRTDFFEAARRAAQMGFDLRVSGATGFFSWPSRNTLSGYAADGASIEASEKAITTFITDFAQKSGASKVHIVAHSMGNRGLLRALQRISADAELRAGIRFGQIFLAAPDIDRDVFLDLASLYKQFADRTTLYASNGDKALYLSGKLEQHPRAGYFLPYTVTEAVDTVAVPNFRIDLMAHGYYASAAPMLNDMYDLIRNNTPPKDRQRITALEYEDQHLWEITR